MDLSGIYKASNVLYPTVFSRSGQLTCSTVPVGHCKRGVYHRRGEGISQDEAEGQTQDVRG